MTRARYLLPAFQGICIVRQQPLATERKERTIRFIEGGVIDAVREDDTTMAVFLDCNAVGRTESKVPSIMPVASPNILADRVIFSPELFGNICGRANIVKISDKLQHVLTVKPSMCTKGEAG